MNLSNYYEQLPTVNAPKTEFVSRVARLCGVNDATVRLWVKGKTKPNNPEHFDILAEETGIDKENLFAK